MTTSAPDPVHEAQLLPGIPNEIILFQIMTKLTFKDVLVLSLVSPAWRLAARSRQLYNTRVHSGSTETLVLLNYEKRIGDGRPALAMAALYSMLDGRIYELPPMPHLDYGGIPRLCQAVTLDGKLYILGGKRDWFVGELRGGMDISDKVHVLDLAAGERQWKQCANMQIPGRVNFGCGVIGGSIYVFGAERWSEDAMCCKLIGDSEVYDPKENAWSPIMPMISNLGWDYHVAALGEELFVYSVGESVRHEHENSAQIYHPIKNEWRLLEGFLKPNPGSIFMVNGKFHFFPFDTQVYHVEENIQVPLRSSSFALRILATVGNDLLAVVERAIDVYDRESYLVHSKGFDCEIERKWQKVPIPIPFAEWPYRCTHYFMHTIQL